MAPGLAPKAKAPGCEGAAFGAAPNWKALDGCVAALPNAGVVAERAKGKPEPGGLASGCAAAPPAPNEKPPELGCTLAESVCPNENMDAEAELVIVEAFDVPKAKPGAVGLAPTEVEPPFTAPNEKGAALGGGAGFAVESLPKAKIDVDG